MDQILRNDIACNCIPIVRIAMVRTHLILIAFLRILIAYLRKYTAYLGYWSIRYLNRHLSFSNRGNKNWENLYLYLQ